MDSVKCHMVDMHGLPIGQAEVDRNRREAKAVNNGGGIPTVTMIFHRLIGTSGLDSPENQSPDLTEVGLLLAVSVYVFLCDISNANVISSSQHLSEVICSAIFSSTSFGGFTNRIASASTGIGPYISVASQTSP